MKQLDKDGGSRTCAKVILDVLRSTGDTIVDWCGMDSKQREAAKELIILTHVAEAAIPEEKEERG